MNCKNKRFGHNFSNNKCLSCNDPQQTLTVTHRGERYEREKEKLGKHKIDYSFQELYFQMKPHFKNFYWIFNKYPENAIRIAFKKRQEEGVYRIDYLLSDLRK